MIALLLPFAKRKLDNELVSANEVERGLACNCVCPSCNVEVIAKQGLEREWHFAHVVGGKCSEGYEVSIHELAKQLLKQRKKLLLPSLVASVRGIDAYGSLIEENELVLKSRTVLLDKCETGLNLDKVNVDVIGEIQNRKILIEISVFHRLMPDKRSRLLATGIPSIQIDLKRFKSTQVNRKLLEKALFEDEDVRRWIYHPKFQPALEVAQSKLAKHLQIKKYEWDQDKLLQDQQAKIIKQKQPDIREIWTQNNHKFDLMFRSALPSPEKINLSVAKLAERTGISQESILSITSAYTNRGELQSFTPEEFIEKFSAQLNLPINEITDFLVNSGYLMRC